jgi:CO/xanthine dehydrogenase Mo-binding subunit
VAGIVEVHVVDQPGLPFFGTAEAAQGLAAALTLADALAGANGILLRDMPVSPERVNAAIAVI